MGLLEKLITNIQQFLLAVHDWLIGQFKPFCYMVWITFLSVVSPIQPILYVLFIVWVINFFMGLGAGVKQGEEFNLKKAFESIKQIAFLGVSAMVIYFVPTLLEDEPIGQTGVKYLAYIISYFYTTNSFRNATKIWPGNSMFDFMYSLLSTQIFSQLKNYLGIKNNGRKGKSKP
jgi:hypothetical protein